MFAQPFRTAAARRSCLVIGAPRQTRDRFHNIVVVTYEYAVSQFILNVHPQPGERPPTRTNQPLEAAVSLRSAHVRSSKLQLFSCVPARDTVLAF
jgi:hypothetical protein